ncbi:unnamed protein product [Tilletia controversa]|nr:unnamed protein product [Tilletia controversa]CAD6964449.1 unnamed protein product [Tilletia controversa]CAD6967176.1 unnamed protein product [Tilletia controversa]
MAGARASAAHDGLAPPSATSPGGSTHGGAGTGPRTAKACTQCSVKKRRCDGGQPICSVCSTLGITCTYNNNPLRRGPPKGFRADPETSAKARLMRKLETTIRDLVAQLGKEQAAREVIRVSLERGIDETMIDRAKAEPGVEDAGGGAGGSGGYGTTEHDSEYDSGRSPKRARTDGPAGSAHVPLHPHHHQTFARPPMQEPYPGSAAATTPQTQHVPLRPAGTASYGYPPRSGGPSYSHPQQSQQPQPHPHPHLAHLAHEASMLRRAHPSGPQPQQQNVLPYHVKSQEEDDDFLGVTERGDLVHRGSSSGIGLLNRTHTQIQQHGQPLPSSTVPFGASDRYSQYASSPGSDRTLGHPTGRVFLPPISSIHGGPHQFAAPSPMSMSGTVPLPLPPGSGYPTHHTYPGGPGASTGAAYTSPAGYPSQALYSNSARSSPAPYDERGRAAFSGPPAQSRPLSTDAMRGRSPPPMHHDMGPGGMAHSGPSGMPENRPYQRLKDEHRMSSLSPARSGAPTLGQPPSPRSRWSERSDDERVRPPHEEEARSYPHEHNPGSVPGNGGLPRIELTQEEKNLLFKYYYSDFHPFWPVLFKPALDAIPSDQLPDRLDEVLLYAIWTMGSAVMPNMQHSSDESRQTQDGHGGGHDTSGTDAADDSMHDGGRNISASERAAITRLRSLSSTFFECAEAHLFASRLRPTVSTIQCLFLLSLYSHGCGELSRAWVYSGLACAMLMDLGLHRWPIHRIELLHESAERETRTRLIWCVYILDKVLSAEMGRPVILRATDCDAPFLSEVEGDELEPWSGSVSGGSLEGGPNNANGTETTQYIHAPSCLNWGIRLFQIVEKILSSVHAFRRKAQLRRNANAHHILVEIDKELNRWKAALPEWLSLERLENTRKAGEAKDREQRAAGSMDGGAAGGSRPQTNSFTRSRPLPSFFLLHLWYFTSTLLLHRPFIPQDEGALLSEVLANESHRKCTEAANTICDLVESSSTPVDRLSTDLAYCIFTAAVLQLFNARLADAQIASAARRRLNLCRQWLKQLSDTWPAASAHKQLLDGFSIVGQGAMEDTEVQLGLEAAAAAVAADVDAAAAASALGNVGRNGVDPNHQEGMNTVGSGPGTNNAAGIFNLSIDGVPTASAHSVAPSTGPRPLDQHSGAQLRNLTNSSVTGGTGAVSNTSPSMLAMPGSGRLLMFNGTSPLNIPVPSISRSPFFSLNTGKALPLFGGSTFLLDGGGSALGTASGPVTPQQRAQMAQYQAYMASFQSRYANTMASTGGNGVMGGDDGSAGGAGEASSALTMNNTFGNIGSGPANSLPMSSVGTWMVPNTSMTMTNNGMGSQQLVMPPGPAPAPEVRPGPSVSTTGNEIMTPMRMVHADAQAQAHGAQRDGSQNGSSVDFSGLNSQDGVDGLGMDTSSVSLAMPTIMADAPVGLWDIENFFWNERSAGAASGNSAYMSNNLPEAALEQTVPGVGAAAQGVTSVSTPSTVFQLLPPLPPNGNTNGSSNGVDGTGSGPARPPTSSGSYGFHGFGSSGSTGPAASFQQLYSQVHSRKMSNNSGGQQGGHGVNGGGPGPDGVGPATGGVGSGRGHPSELPPTNGLSMLAEVTAGGGGLDRSTVAAAASGVATSSTGPTSAISSGPMSARLSSGSLTSAGTPMLGVQPSRRMTPLVGSGNPPSGGFTFNSGNGMGTPSFGGTGNTPLFNIGMGLGMSSSGSNPGMGGGGMGAAHGNSIISLSPFGFSMTPDPVVWDALALLELPPSFAKV